MPDAVPLIERLRAARYGQAAPRDADVSAAPRSTDRLARLEAAVEEIDARLGRLEGAPPVRGRARPLEREAPTAELVRAAVAELVDFWARLPIDPVPPDVARRELLDMLPTLRRLADAADA